MKALTDLRITKIDPKRAFYAIHIGHGRKIGDVVRWSETALRKTLEDDGIELERV